MKNTKVKIIVLFVIICLVLSLNIHAVSAPFLRITGEKNVEVNKTIQLKAEYGATNDMYIEGTEIGEFYGDDVTNECTWTSRDYSIATVDSKGKVTGLKEGTVIINAKYNDESSGEEYEENYEIVVYEESELESTGIYFFRSIPTKANILNEEQSIVLNLRNIPNTEKQNVNIEIEDENIAKIKKIDVSDTEDSSIYINVKYLALGSTKLNATLEYNGELYKDSYNIYVIESLYSIKLRAKDDEELPLELKIGEELQLKATFEIYGGSVLPKDITKDENVIWTSSDAKIAKVDKNGLITAVGEGNATIRVSYKVGEETVSEKYDIKIVDPNKKNNSNEENKNKDNDATTSNKKIPKAGKSITTIMIGIIAINIIRAIIYKRYNNYKDIK